MRSCLLVSLVVLMAAGSAVAQTPADKLLFKKPDGFVLFNQAGNQTLYDVEFVPEGEQKGSVWTTRLMLQGIREEKIRSPADYTTTFSDSFAKGCAQAR